ncbi:uncharacterized protein LOC143256635 [Tachypleus tridentatus]|uniref:uncharacterized protein LOC143256635 n=1 Tax=Tachypleus tridentatus TaxID=6853 RepID=UPI003FCF387E
MRLKSKVRHLKEESFLLNRIQQGWNSLQVTEKQLLFNFNNNHRVSYSCNLASPSEDESDRAMSLSSPEIICRNGSAEYDVLSESDLDSNCTSPLLKTLTLKEHTNGGNRELGVRDDCNNNGNSASSSSFSPREDLESGDSIFSDISEDSSQDYSLDHSEGSHDNYDVSETEINSRKELIRLNELSFRDQLQSNLPDCVAQEWQVYSALFKKQKFDKTLIKQHASKDQHMHCSDAPESGSSEFMDFTPISETSSSSDFDINMATETLNNFSMATSKHCDIQCLVNKEEENANINIQENESTTTCLEEPKILNTASTIPKNITDKFQNEQAFEFITSKVKCEFDSGEKENRKKENINDSPPLKKSSNCINTKYGGPIPSAVKPVIETLFMEHLFSINDDKKDKITYFSSCKKNSGEMPEPLDIDSDNLTPEIKKTNERSENPYEHVELPMPNMDVGLGSRDDTSIISLQKQHSGDLAVISPCHHVTKQKEVYSVGNSDVETFLLSNTLNNNSIMNSAVYKNMAENVKLPIVCVSTRTTQPSSLTEKDKSKYIYPQKDKYKSSSEVLGNFDVCNIETTMPKIDWTAMETHLTQAAKEPDWYLRHQHDREEIRKKLAMDSDSEDYYCGERVTKKPSLSTRLQSGMNLQICFMNETASDQESQGSDQDAENYCQNDNLSEELSNEKIIGGSTVLSYYDKTKSSKSLTESTNSSQVSGTKRQRPSFFFNRPRRWSLQSSHKNRETKEKVEEDFITRQARLQTEARLALAQAKVMARMQMEVEKQRKKKSPIADIVGIPLPDGHCHLSRQF